MQTNSPLRRARSGHRVVSLKTLLACGLLALSSLALALPAPKDIEASVNAGQLDRAESQLREVLREKPSSAKAHYELGQVLAREKRYVEARDALHEARRIDPSLKFASSAQRFNDLLDTVNARAATEAPASLGSTAPRQSSPARAATSPVDAPARATPIAPQMPVSIPWGMLLMGIGGIALIVLLVRRGAASNAGVTSMGTAPMPAGGTGFGQSAQTYPAAQGYPPAQGGTGFGSAATGAVVGGLAGMAAGYALSKALDGDHHGSTAVASTSSSGDYIPFSQEPAKPDLGAFDEGSGEGWGDASGDTDDDSNTW